MSKTNQGSTRSLASNIAVIGVIGYGCTYIPSLLAYWEDTWYPHGRELRVIMPDPNPDGSVVALPTEPGRHSGTRDASAGEGWSFFNPAVQSLPTNQVFKPNGVDTLEVTRSPNIGLETKGLANKTHAGPIDET